MHKLHYTRYGAFVCINNEIEYNSFAFIEIDDAKKLEVESKRYDHIVSIKDGEVVYTYNIFKKRQLMVEDRDRYLVATDTPYSNSGYQEDVMTASEVTSLKLYQKALRGLPQAYDASNDKEGFTYCITESIDDVSILTEEVIIVKPSFIK